MMGILLKSAAMFALLISAPTVPDTVSHDSPVPLVMCSDAAGSAFRVGPGLILSVNHVVTSGGCEIGGKPIHTLYTSATLDFAILEDHSAGKFFKVDCSGFVKGRLYLAVGHIRAGEQLSAIPMIATGQTDNGLSVLAGLMEAQPGMSGGPVIDAQTHEVVGSVNMAQWEDGLTFSRELRTTSVCQP
jgi:hypothetical protein